MGGNSIGSNICIWDVVIELVMSLSRVTVGFRNVTMSMSMDRSAVNFIV